MIANARMYAVSLEAEAAWQELLAGVCRLAQVPLNYLPYPAPQPLEPLWQRADIGAVLMCGYPIRLKIAEVQPIAAPVPGADWAAGRAVYRTDLIVRADSSFARLEDTFGHQLGWTVSHSHSGFNALRHHLLRYRTRERPRLYGQVFGDLITARAVLDRVVDGTVDVGPLDGYWHHLLRLHRPELVRDVRVVESTDVAPIPCFVAARDVPCDVVAQLRAAFVAAPAQDWFAPLGERLALKGFAPVNFETYAPLTRWQDEALAAGYPLPA